MDDNFKFNFVLQCGQCKVRNACPISSTDDKNYCGWELEDYEDLMFALSQEYALNKSGELVAEQLIANMLIAKRGMRELKFKGLTTTIHTKEGVLKIENPIKQGLHLEVSRIIRLFKEMKLTPKEKMPTTKKVESKQIMLNIVKQLGENERIELGAVTLTKDSVLPLKKTTKNKGIGD